MKSKYINFLSEVKSEELWKFKISVTSEIWAFYTFQLLLVIILLVMWNSLYAKNNVPRTKSVKVVCI